MAIIGVSKPYYAKYSAVNGVVSYSGGGLMGMMTSVDVVIEGSEDNNLFGDNGVAETDRTFTSGTLTLSTTDLSPEITKDLLGVVSQELEEIPGVTDQGVMELIYDDRQAIPYIASGFIIKKRIHHVNFWRAVVLTKVMFSVPSDSATTQGESIEWQVPELVGTIMRDDSETHRWKRESTFTTEAQAEAYIRHRLNIGAETVAAMFSRAGLNIGGEEV